jgi:flagellar biogenesis protein FliO
MDLARDVAAVLAVFGILAATLWALRRAGAAKWRVPGRTRSRGRMEVVERVALGPQQALHLVRLGTRALLIASHPAGCSLIESTPWQDCAASGRQEPL